MKCAENKLVIQRSEIHRPLQSQLSSIAIRIELHSTLFSILDFLSFIKDLDFLYITLQTIECSEGLLRGIETSRRLGKESDKERYAPILL